jgi:glycerol transport system permease protein
MKPVNNKAWLLVLPVLLLVAFSAVVPLMTVVNYSVQDSFGNNEFFWNGIYWFDDLLHSERMWDALGRQILFSAIVLADRGAARHLHRAQHAEEGFWASLCLV